jgi:hypothetical protein
MPTGIAGRHLVRFGTAADQGYFLDEFADTYDQIVVNANMLAHMPAAMATFLSVRARKPFMIDPQTVAFQHEVGHLLSTSKKSAGEIKKSWRRLIRSYGNPVERAIVSKSRPILPDDFSSDKECRDFCSRVVAFQSDELANEFQSGEDADYVKFLAEEEGADNLVSPSLIVAPYFFLNAQFFDEWLDVNLRCLKSGREALEKGRNRRPLAAQLVISQEVLLADEMRSKLIKTYHGSGAKPDVFLLWVDSLNEQELSVHELNAYVSLVQGLAEGGHAVVNLYGGYFSVAAARFGALKNKLVGICHGLEYGESKPVVPITGGVPVAKYYLPSVHARLPARVSTRAIRELGGFKNAETFRQRICNCRVCKSVIRGNPAQEFSRFTDTKVSAFWRSGRRVAMEFPTAETSDNCAQHYMWRKHVEYTEATTIEKVCTGLKSGFDNLKTPIGLEFVGHCAIWPKVLQGKA